MKKIKFILAIVGMTIAIFGNVIDTEAKPAKNICGPGNSACETTSNGSTISGDYYITN